MNFYDFKKSSIFFIILLLLLLFSLTIISQTSKFSNSIKSNIKTFFLIDRQFLDLNKGLYEVAKEILFKNYYSYTKLDTISIDMNFSDFENLKKIRAQSISNNYLFSKKYLNTKLSYNNKILFADVRLDGLFNDHWSLQKQWSLKFKIKNNEAIKGYTNFTLSNHFTRQFPYNQIISSINSHYGILSPRSETIRVIINGEWWGNMLLEEDMSDSFLELNKKKVNPIFRFEDIYSQLAIRKEIRKLLRNENFDYFHQTDLLSKQYLSHFSYNRQKKYFNDPNYHKIISKVKTIFTKIEEDKINNKELNEILDIEKFSISIFNSLIFGTSGHGLQYQNIRFYFNIFSNRLEPIPRDNFYIRDLQATNVIENKEIDNLQDTIENLPQIFYKIIKTDEFKKIYDDYISDFSEFNEILNEYIRLHCMSFGQSCIDSVETEIIKKNYNYLKTNKVKNFLFNYTRNQKKQITINNNLDLYTKDLQLIDLRIFNNGNIEIKNIFPEKVKIDEIEFICKTECTNKTTSKKIKTNIFIKPFENLTINVKNLDKINLELFDSVIVTSILNKNIFKKEYLIENFLDASTLFLKNNVKLHPYLMIKDGDYHFKKGKWIINDPIIIPKYRSLNISEGTELLFNENSFIFIDHGNLNIKGSVLNTVKLKPQNKFWRGIYVKNSKNSNIYYSNIEGVKNFNGINTLTGSIIFYNSFIKIQNVNFNNSLGEDMLNIVKSSFQIDSSKFNNTYSDALDIDFSEGKITNSSFNQVGGDGIDTSGSNVKINNIEMHDIYDKSFSVGEKSKVNISNSFVNNVGVGIVSKDESNTVSNNNIIKNYKLARYLAYNKKKYYEGSSLFIFDKFKNNNDIFSQIGSNVYLNNTKINNIHINVEKLYENSLMKKK